MGRASPIRHSPVIAQGSGNGTVLVVDDEVLVPVLVAGDLDETGFEVIKVSNAQTALKRRKEANDEQVLFTDTNTRWPKIGLVVSSGCEPTTSG